ncbi:MAG: hypothetical protein M3277_08550 [Actinomycetota bacterium]|nr:hypothetical protein [Actinomycetota bacterium]
MPRGARWRAPSRLPKNAASNSERLPPPRPEDWTAYLGRKISIRLRLHGDPEHPFSEAIGVVSRVSGTDLSILNKKGETVTVAFDDVIAGKVFP